MGVQDTSASGIQAQQEENRRLRRAVEELSILNDLARAIGGSFNLQDIMQTIIHRSLRAIQAEQGVITLVDREPNAPMKTLVRTMVSSASHSQFHFNQSLLGWMHLNKKPLLLNDPRTDERFRGVRWDDSVRSLLCVPMIVKASLIGVLTAYNKRGSDQFTEEDQRLLAIIAGQSAQVVENARLYEEEQALMTMREEIRLAARIQLDLLPKSPPAVPGYEVAGKSIPAQLVGGDYFDFIAMDGERLAVCLGDVSGKGLPASLLMANLQATLRGQTLLNESCRTCVRRANKLLYQSTSAEKFVTLFYSILNPVTHCLCYTNAGHETPLLLSKGHPVQGLSTGGVVLSILEDFPYEEQSVELGPGDLIVVYSDGVTEAVNPGQEQFGVDRLRSVVEQHRDEAPSALVDQVIGAVQAHAGAAPQMDDITLVAVRRLEQ